VTGHRHQLRIRYGECDMQQVVFNANYLAYIDDAIDTWFRTALGDFESVGFDFMIKKLTLEWQSPARFGEVLELAVGVQRWGTTSFDVGVVGTVDGRPVITATAVYVSTTPGAPTPVPVPEVVRRALDPAG
jgi:acyl-CoA thioester hydrolase